MEILNKNGLAVAVIDKSEKITDTQAALDAMATAQYLGANGAMIVYQESLGADFFDLKTRFAGEVLQKFSNYRVRLAIVGDFTIYKSKALHDFIYECNQGNLVLFKDSLAAALASLAPTVDKKSSP